MKDWCIEDRNGEVFVLHGDTYTEKKKIYPDEDIGINVELYLLYNDIKPVGYQLNYKYDDKYPKFLTYNSFGIIYNKRKTNFKTTFEVIFEDSNIRLLTYEHQPNSVRDYFLVGRWRSSSLNSSDFLMDAIKE